MVCYLKCVFCVLPNTFLFWLDPLRDGDDGVKFTSLIPAPLTDWRLSGCLCEARSADNDHLAFIHGVLDGSEAIALDGLA